MRENKAFVVQALGRVDLFDVAVRAHRIGAYWTASVYRSHRPRAGGEWSWVVSTAAPPLNGCILHQREVGGRQPGL